MPKLYVLHAAFVHFPIALLVTGLAGEWVDRAGVWKRSWLADAVSWLLWLGTASAWAAAGLGLLAEKTAPHVPPAWETLADHKSMAIATAGLFLALSLWRRFFKTSRPGLFAVAWLACAGALIVAASLGGELVFTYNMGTVASEP